MELKDKIELLHKVIDSAHKQSDVYYKKAFILLAVLGGIGTVLIKIEFNEYLKILLMFIFFIISLGLFSIHSKLSKINKEIDNYSLELKGLLNDK